MVLPSAEPNLPSGWADVLLAENGTRMWRNYSGTCRRRRKVFGTRAATGARAVPVGEISTQEQERIFK